MLFLPFNIIFLLQEIRLIYTLYFLYNSFNNINIKTKQAAFGKNKKVRK